MQLVNSVIRGYAFRCRESELRRMENLIKRTGPKGRFRLARWKGNKTIALAHNVLLVNVCTSEHQKRSRSDQKVQVCGLTRQQDIFSKTRRLYIWCLHKKKSFWTHLPPTSIRDAFSFPSPPHVLSQVYGESIENKFFCVYLPVWNNYQLLSDNIPVALQKTGRKDDPYPASIRL